MCSFTILCFCFFTIYFLLRNFIMLCHGYQNRHDTQKLHPSSSQCLFGHVWMNKCIQMSIIFFLWLKIFSYTSFGDQKQLKIFSHPIFLLLNWVTEKIQFPNFLIIELGDQNFLVSPTFDCQIGQLNFFLVCSKRKFCELLENF